MPRFVFDLQLALDAAETAAEAAERDVESALRDCVAARATIRACEERGEKLEHDAQSECRIRTQSARVADRVALDAWLAHQQAAREQAAAAVRDAKLDLRYFEIRVLLRAEERGAAQNRLTAYERLRSAAKSRHGAMLLRREDEWSDELAQHRLARERGEAAR